MCLPSVSSSFGSFPSLCRIKTPPAEGEKIALGNWSLSTAEIYIFPKGRPSRLVHVYINTQTSYILTAAAGREKGRHAKGGVLDSIQDRPSVKGSPSYVLFHDNTRSKRNFLFFLEKNPACAVFFFFRWSSIEITSRLTYLFMRVEEAESLTSFLLFFFVSLYARLLTGQ